jgi:hypothetical protein
MPPGTGLAYSRRTHETSVAAPETTPRARASTDWAGLALGRLERGLMVVDAKTVWIPWHE